MTSKTNSELRRGQAHNLLKHLLNGEHFTRKTMPPDVGEHNDSLHSVVSILKNEMYFPVQSTRKGFGGLASYSATDADIEQFNLGGEYREAQRQRVRAEVRSNRLDRGVRATERMAEVLEEMSRISEEAAAKLRAAAHSILDALKQ